MNPFDLQLSKIVHNERIQDAENQRRFYQFGTIARDSAQAQSSLSKALISMSQKLKIFSGLRTSYVHGSSK